MSCSQLVSHSGRWTKNTFSTNKWTCCGGRNKNSTLCDSEPPLLQNNCVYVKAGLNGLQHGLALAKDQGIQTIILEDGIHVCEMTLEHSNYVVIDFAVTIIGSEHGMCYIYGGLMIYGKSGHAQIERNFVGHGFKYVIPVTIKCINVRGSKENGIFVDEGASIHLENVRVDQSGGIGVYLSNGNKNTMRNVEVSQSGSSGIFSMEGNLKISGPKSRVSHNCLLNNDTHYGLNAYGATSVIDIVLPLTKKILSYNNNGGGNWGGGGKFNKKIEVYIMIFNLGTQHFLNKIKNLQRTIHVAKT